MLLLPAPLFSVALFSCTTAPEPLDPTSQYSGRLTAALKSWQASPFCLCLQRGPLPPELLPLCECTLSPPERVFQAALRRRLFSPLAVLQDIGSLPLTDSAASCDTVSEPELGLVQHPLNYINRPWTERQKWPYLNSRKLTAVTLSNKNTQGEHFRGSFCMERQKTSCTRKTSNQPLKWGSSHHTSYLLEAKECLCDYSRNIPVSS